MSIKKHLQTLSKEQLIKQIIELHDKYKDVKTYYQYFINPSDTRVSEKFKKIISNEFFPSRGGHSGPKLSVARKAVNDFKKLSPPPEDLADMMLYYVENGVAFTNAYGDISEAFYSSMEKMFDDVCKLIIEYQLTNDFQPRCKEILNDTQNMGWGFNDSLRYSYHSYFQE